MPWNHRPPWGKIGHLLAAAVLLLSAGCLGGDGDDRGNAVLTVLAGETPAPDGCDIRDGDLNGNDRLDIGDATGGLQAAARSG